MKRALIFTILMASSACAQEAAPAATAPGIEAAEQALDARLPEVAIQKLNALLADGTITDQVRTRAEGDLTRAMLNAGDADGALARLDYPVSDQERLWKAEALSALGRWDDAEPLYAEVAGNGTAGLIETAAIGDAEALHELSRMPEAIAVLVNLETHSTSTLVRLRLAELYLENRQPDVARQLLAKAKPETLMETRWRQYVEGRLYLAEDQAAPARQDFDELLTDPRGLTPALQAGATIGLTEARIALTGLETADDVLEAFIWKNPESPYLEDMFRRLDAIYAQEGNPSESELKHWAAQGPPRRAALAVYYEGRSFQHQDGQEKEAIRAYTEFVQRFPKHAFAFEAWMQLGQLYYDQNRVPTAVAAFEGAIRHAGDPRQKARAEIGAGNAYFAEGETGFLPATEHFHDAAESSNDPNLWLQATYDSALAWLHVGNYDRFLNDYTALSQRFPETDQRRDLLLEEGLLQARSGDARAAATLESFIRDFPDNHRIAEARVALAELVFAAGDMNSASNLTQAAYVSDPSDQSREQADYLAIFIADSAADRQDGNVLKLGKQFLTAYPNSPLRAQVRMKLGQVYFRREDYANAQTQFETLAQESAGDPLVDQALILAGQSSVKSMSGTAGITHALDLYNQVAKGTGPLRLYARQEQALLKAQTGQSQEAVIIYDDILRSNPDTPLRLAALCGKADCLVAATNDAAAPSPSPASAGASQTDPCVAAIALYDQIVNDPDSIGPWRDEALYKKARCLTRQGQTDQALTALYDILNVRPATAKQQQPDFFWFEKAGYDAAAALEAKSQWPGAISILEKIAQAGGPRSAEARKHADQLRLEHFVWE